jgi:hypothetical protein
MTSRCTGRSTSNCILYAVLLVVKSLRANAKGGTRRVHLICTLFRSREAISPYRSSQFAPALSGSPPDPAPPSVMQGMIDWRPALLARWLRCSAGGTGSAGSAGRSRALPPTKRGRTSHPIATERRCGPRTSAWWPKPGQDRTPVSGPVKATALRGRPTAGLDGSSGVHACTRRLRGEPRPLSHQGEPRQGSALQSTPYPHALEPGCTSPRYTAITTSVSRRGDSLG